MSVFSLIGSISDAAALTSLCCQYSVQHVGFSEEKKSILPSHHLLRQYSGSTIFFHDVFVLENVAARLLRFQL